MSWIDDLFGGGKQSAGNDMYNEMMKAWQNAQGFMNPYIQEGQNPAALYNQYASSYKESPEALAQQQVGQKAANQANAVSGMLGSGAAQTEAANLAQSVRSEDFDKYMSNLYATHNQGFNASNNLSTMMEKMFEDMAQGRGLSDEGRAQGISGAAGTAGDFLSHLFGNFNLGGGGGGAKPWLNPDTGMFG